MPSVTDISATLHPKETKKTKESKTQPTSTLFFGTLISQGNNSKISFSRSTQKNKQEKQCKDSQKKTSKKPQTQ